MHTSFRMLGVKHNCMREASRTRSYICRVIGGAFLAPPVIDAILEGRRHARFNAYVLRQANAVPVCWNEQVRKFLPSD